MRLADQLYSQNEHWRRHFMRAMRFHRWEGFIVGFVAGGLFAALVALAIMVLR